MRKIVLSIAFAICIIGTTSAFSNSSSLSFDKEVVLKTKEYPSEIVAFVNKHFPERKVLQIVKESELFDVTYEVILDDRTRLDFNKSKKVEEIDSLTEIPHTLLQPEVVAYVKERFPNQVIISWELDDRKQQIELDNGLELEFTKNGKFIKIDD